MHANARLTPIGRLTMVLRIESGRPVAHVATEMGISHPTAYKWWHRWIDEGELGLVDRPSSPRSCPHRTSPEVEAQIEELRRTLKLGPARIGYRLGVPTSTVHRVLTRLGISRLSWMDRPTGRVIRRYERDHPGELVHVDIKKLGRNPRWWRFEGAGAPGPASRTATRTDPTESATGSFTQPWMITVGWPTARSSMTSARRPPPGSGSEPRSGLPTTESTSRRYSPTFKLGSSLGSTFSPAGGMRISRTGAYPLPLLTDRSVREHDFLPVDHGTGGSNAEGVLVLLRTRRPTPSDPCW